jgi:hypothetical protein
VKNRMVWIGLDDTDNAESRGTGSLARRIAADLAADYPVLGVTRHQLLEDPRVPCTKRNSCAAIHLDIDELDEESLTSRVREIMASDYQDGSDPGLCVAREIPNAVIAFGRFTQIQLVTQKSARELAANHGIRLLGLGGDEGGVIGALAAVGLAAQGDDGRYVQVGTIRDLSGLQPVSALLKAGVSAVQTLEGNLIHQGMVLTDKLRPARRGGVPVAVVEWDSDHWLPLKLN